jgi:hypothetical protein
MAILGCGRDIVPVVLMVRIIPLMDVGPPATATAMISR